MVSIQFTKDASYDVATDRGGTTKVGIAAGTVKHGLSEAEAHRWERRGVAKRVTGPVEAAPMPPAPPSGIPEGNDPGIPGVTPAPPAPPSPPSPAGEEDKPLRPRGRPAGSTRSGAGDPGND